MTRLASRRILTAVFAAFFLAIALPANAHVTVQPASAHRGATLDLAFRVPNERAHANTVSFIVQFPEIAHVAPVQVPAGWHTHVTTRRLAVPLHTEHGEIHSVVDTIEWTGSHLAPKEVGLFHVLIGPLPIHGDVLTFKANQKYSNGEIVRWIETQHPGQAAPQRPAPVLQLLRR